MLTTSADQLEWQLLGSKGELARRCGCFLDGMGGDYCDQPHEQFCINQCSEQGVCYLGFCKCDPGWFGHDCTNRVTGLPAPEGESISRNLAYESCLWQL